MKGQLSLFQDFEGDSNLVSAEKYIMMSLQEQYYLQIIDGTKKYEYRRLFKNYALNSFIYITSPVKLLTGYLKLGEPIIGTPKQIADLAESIRVGHGAIMYDYMKDLRKCYAIPINSIFEFEQPLALDSIKTVFPKFTPPQSYILMENYKELLDYLLGFKVVEKKVQIL
jgi:predicted transcriptional regulator